MQKRPCEPLAVTFEIRLFARDDLDEVVAFAVRAWAPIFDSLRAILGGPLFGILRGDDWKPGQAAAVKEAIKTGGALTWVATVDGVCCGFATASLSADGEVGEIVMVAVDPDYQRRGLGAALTETAIEALRARGASVVMVETGGDPGHSAARATYERTGFTALPVVRYFKSF